MGGPGVIGRALLGVLCLAGGVAAAQPEDRRESLLDPWGRQWLLLDGLPKQVQSDGDATLNVGGLIQFQSNASVRQQDAGQSVDDFESGFRLRRTRVKLSGDLGLGTDGARTPFVVQTQATQGGTLTMIDAFFGWERGPWRVKAGQFIVPFSREGTTAVTKRLAVDFSPTTAFFAFGGPLLRGTGIEARYLAEDWSATVMLNDGDGGGRASFEQDETDLGLMARVERRFGGSWKQFGDATARRGTETALLLGAATNVSIGEGDASMDGLQRETFAEARWTADASFETNGWTAYGAVYGLHRDDQGADGTNQYGANAHAGVYVDDMTELYTQYSWITDEDTPGRLSVLFVGVNRYLAGHAIKAQADVGVALEPVPAQFANTSLGILPDAAGERGQVMLRGMVQLVF